MHVRQAQSLFKADVLHHHRLEWHDICLKRMNKKNAAWFVCSHEVKLSGSVRVRVCGRGGIFPAMRLLRRTTTTTMTTSKCFGLRFFKSLLMFVLKRFSFMVERWEGKWRLQIWAKGYNDDWFESLLTTIETNWPFARKRILLWCKIFYAEIIKWIKTKIREKTNFLSRKRYRFILHSISMFDRPWRMEINKLKTFWA